MSHETSLENMYKSWSSLRMELLENYRAEHPDVFSVDGIDGAAIIPAPIDVMRHITANSSLPVSYQDVVNFVKKLKSETAARLESRVSVVAIK